MTITESFIIVWLKHIEKCQITQTKWKPAFNSWELQSEDQLQKLMDITEKFFHKNYHLNLYKHPTNPRLFLQEGEIGVLGFKLSADASAIYGVSTYDEYNVEYGSGLDLLEEIIKKMIKTALLTIGFLSTSKAKILFASPKIHTKTSEELLHAFTGLTNIFEAMGYDFTFEIHTNDQFRDIISEPAKKLAAASSEQIFDRIQKYQGKKESFIDNRDNVKHHGDQETTKIGKFIRVEFEKLIERGLITEEILQHLCDSKYSKEVLGLRYPMIKKYNDQQSMTEQRLINGSGRYYSHVYRINGQKYLLTNDWYEKNRDHLVTWLGKFKYKA
jgi:hypothetical protein